MSYIKYSIIDVETTGFSPKMGDRIIELSIINVNEQGEILDSFETLINPKRDVGASWVHGITAEMVFDAPTFNEIADYVIELLEDSFIVAHNASFDLRFINYELQLAKTNTPELKGLCTLNLSRRILPDLPSKKLALLCEYFDITIQNAHSAYHDCLATSQVFMKLLKMYVEEYGFGRFEREYLLDCQCRFGITKSNSSSRVEFKREHASNLQVTKIEKLQKMIHRLPDYHTSSNLPVHDYLNLLDEILADRMVTEEESQKLFALSKEFDVSQHDALEIHEEYLRRLVGVYLLDNVITESEFKDLSLVSKILGINDRLNLIIDLEKVQLKSTINGVERESDYAGKSVCFTGQLMSKLDGVPIDRKLAQELALQKGLTIKSGVSSNLDYLIVADPHTQSSKAKRAKEAGVKIVAEPVFWKMIGVNVE